MYTYDVRRVLLHRKWKTRVANSVEKSCTQRSFGIESKSEGESRSQVGPYIRILSELVVLDSTVRGEVFEAKSSRRSLLDEVLMERRLRGEVLVAMMTS
jgi:hypothetical protein